MNMTEILKFAIEGVNAEIDKRERTISKGKQRIKQIENGERSGSIYEVKEVIKIRREEIEELLEKKFDYEWELAMLNEKSAY